MVSTPATDSTPDLNVDNLRAVRVLGRGAMGTVFLVHDSSTDPSGSSPFALKVLDKSSALNKPDADRRARWEISVLSRLSPANHPHPHRHPFLPHLIGSFETDDLLGWAIPYCPGGDLNALRYHQTDRVFSPAVIKFYLAEIVCALEHLHADGIAYRDLKPENVLIQQSGHVTLTDFDLSRHFNLKKVRSILLQAHDPILEPELPTKKHRKSLTRFIAAAGDPKVLNLKKAKSARVSPVSRRRPSFDDGERSNSFVGTEEYVAPEIVRGDGHEFAVDWWALGVLAYEMLYGTTPFKGKNRKETFRNVLIKPPEFIGKRTPLTDLIGRLLDKDPYRRLGYLRGAAEIKGHPFFNGVKWDLLTEVVRPPFIPSREDDGVEKLTAGGVDVREYFHRQRQPPSMPPSPLPSPSRRLHRSLSLTEF
ncbi:serine/threonine-protein kinase UCNL-like [Punica granatum]|uniref:non-specific serine/threonine protein kinase n=1 Tax=Punica granatum TaxID=22663 RepID=A0A218WLX5_PUNGR|nr:serine/threonine-protein kinase UCNL-like [Punica granatum]OWM73488.1 hypothetical protein CDL15_Pgr026587 [Punica granatum]